MKKCLLALLLLSLCLSLLVGCGMEEIPEDDLLISEAKVLLEKSVAINRLFFEEGIPLKEGGIVSGVYCEADTNHSALMGLKSLEAIKGYLRSIYSQVAISELMRFAVEKQVDGNAIVKPAYCYDYYDENKVFICLMVSTNGLNQQMDKVVFDYDSVKVIEDSKTSEAATLSVKVTVTDGEGNTETKTMRFGLVLENGSWRLDNFITCVIDKTPQK